MLATSLLKYAAWYYLPAFCTRQLLSALHVAYARVFRRAPPSPGTPEYAFHHRMTYLLFATGYLLYNLYDASATVEPNYYEMLGLAPTADEGMLKTAFRQFARRYHPDRAGSQSESMFIEVRDAYDALKSPVKRFAYERFGPEALKWQQCTTLREYVRHGLLQASGFYIVSLCSLVIIHILNPSPVSFWRYIMLALTAVYELLFLLKPSTNGVANPDFSSVLFTDPATASHTGLFGFLWPQRVPYQHVRFLHTLWVLASFALSNVAPVVLPAPSPEFQEKWILNEAQQIATLSTSLTREASALLTTLLHSVHGPRTGTPASPDTFPYLGALPTADGRPADAAVALLAEEMEHLLLEAQIRADRGPLRSAVDNAVERRRREIARGVSVGAGLDGRGAGGQGLGAQGSGSWAAQQPNGSAVAAASPARKERALGYVRGRSRSLG
ncbi:hypothetical protein BD413DRAFT_603418 [Trametes elegans]|nr:hypothetical protein BD413DRAFT_603418 [Trametes elegans]